MNNLPFNIRSFLPNVTCPYCGTTTPAEVSGWGRQGYNNRDKHCRHCSSTFIIEIIVSTCKDKETTLDYEIKGHEENIKRIRKGRKRQEELLGQLLSLERQRLKILDDLIRKTRKRYNWLKLKTNKVDIKEMERKDEIHTD